MARKRDRLERRLVRLAEGLRTRGFTAKLGYLDRFKGSLLGLSVSGGAKGAVGLVVDRSERRLGLLLLSTSKEAAHDLGGALGELHKKSLPRRQLNGRRLAKHVARQAVELDQRFDERMALFPTEAFERLRTLFPTAQPALGNRTRASAEELEADPVAGSKRLTTAFGAMIPEGELVHFVLYDSLADRFLFHPSTSELLHRTQGGGGELALAAAAISSSEGGDFGRQVRGELADLALEAAAEIPGEVVEGAARLAIDALPTDGWDCAPGLDGLDLLSGLDCVPDCGCDVPCL